MEGRNIKKYKRNIKKEEYNPPFSNQFDNLNNPDKLSFDFDINIIKNKKIYKKIEKLPEEIRKYIFIFAMKKYWKEISVKEFEELGIQQNNQEKRDNHGRFKKRKRKRFIKYSC